VIAGNDRPLPAELEDERAVDNFRFADTNEKNPEHDKRAGALTEMRRCLYV
jgi:hypothetical protein